MFGGRQCWFYVYVSLHHLSTFALLENTCAQKFFVKYVIKAVVKQVLKFLTILILSFKQEIFILWLIP